MSVPTGKILNSWKEIAAFLGVSVRAAQNWEKTRGLPVHRHDGATKSRVYALEEELGRWLTVDQVQGPHPGAAPRRLRGLAWGFVGLVLIAGMLFWLVPLFANRAPTEAVFEGTTLRVFDDRRQLLWKHSLPQLQPDGYRNLVQLADLDADGRVEILLRHPRRKRLGKTGTLMLFEASGEVRWSVAVGGSLQRGERQFTNVYGPEWAEIVRVAGRNYVLGMAEHQPLYPAQVLLIDPTGGEIVGEYFHPGHLHDFATTDVDGDGEPELLLGGVNNPGEGEGHPVLVLLDLPFAATAPTDSAHLDFFGNPGPAEIAYIVFPKCGMSAKEQYRAHVESISIADSAQLVVEVVSDIGQLFYYLDLADPARPAVVEMVVSDLFKSTHHILHGQGKIDHPLSAEELAHLSELLTFDAAVDGNNLEWTRPSGRDVARTAPPTGVD